MLDELEFAFINLLGGKHLKYYLLFITFFISFSISYHIINYSVFCFRYLICYIQVMWINLLLFAWNSFITTQTLNMHVLIHIRYTSSIPRHLTLTLLASKNRITVFFLFLCLEISILVFFSIKLFISFIIIFQWD